MRGFCQNVPVVYSTIMDTSEFKTYLGDVICVSGTNKRNIENRRNCAVGSVSQIVSMLDQISLGHYHFEIGLVLRDLYIECAKFPVRFVCQARRLLYY